MEHDHNTMEKKLQPKHGSVIWHNGRLSQFSTVALYLIAIIAANITVAIFGPAVSVLNAFLFIGFNLTARDRLHDTWNGRHLKRNMTLLILAGSLLSFALGAGRIAIASFTAFAASETIDAIAYHLLREKHKLIQINGSNTISAAIDSILFPLIAFGWPPLVGIMIGQFLAKTFGGAIWAVLLNKTVNEELFE